MGRILEDDAGQQGETVEIISIEINGLKQLDYDGFLESWVYLGP